MLAARNRVLAPAAFTAETWRGDLGKSDERAVLWFWPGHTELKAQGAVGTYRVRKDGQPMVRILGEPVEEIGVDHDQEEVLYGFLGKLDLTVLHGPSTFWSPNRPWYRSQTDDLTPRVAFEGKHLTREEMTFTDVSVRFWDQEVWSEWAAFPGEPSYGEDERLRLTIDYAPQSEHHATVGDVRIELLDGSLWGQTKGGRDWHLSSQSRFRLTFPEPVDYDAILNEWLMPLETLIVTTTGRLSGLRSLRLRHRDWPIGPGEGRYEVGWVTARTRQPRRGAERDLDPMQLLYRLSDMNFDAQIPAVISAANRLAYSLDHFALLRDARYNGGELARFVASCQLVDAMDSALRKYKPASKDFATTLLRLDRGVGGLLAEIVGVKKWRDHIRNVRALVVHGGETAHQLTHDARAVYAASTILLLLFEARLVVEFGFTQDQAKALITGRVNHWQYVKAIRDYYPQLRQIADRGQKLDEVEWPIDDSSISP